VYLRTIRIFDSMANTYGPRIQEVLNSGALLKFKNVPLAMNKSVPKINPGQFFLALLITCVQGLSQLKHHMYQKIKMNLKINI